MFTILAKTHLYTSFEILDQKNSVSRNFLSKSLHYHHKTDKETAAERSFTPSLTHLDCGAITPAIIVCKTNMCPSFFLRKKYPFTYEWANLGYSLTSRPGKTDKKYNRLNVNNSNRLNKPTGS